MRQPLSVAMLKSPLLKGSAMLALLGTLSSTWCTVKTGFLYIDIFSHITCL